MNQRGFMLLSAVFLTVIVSFTAMMTLQAITQVQRGDASLRLHAMNLANEKFALIESGSSEDIPEDDLKSYGLYGEKDLETKTPIIFKVTDTREDIGEDDDNLCKVTVTVTWQNEKLEFEKVIRLK